MTWFDTRVEDAMPYILGEEITATAGASWQWTYTFPETADLDSSTYTAGAVIRNKAGDSVASVTVTFPSVQQVRCVVESTSSVPIGRYLHEVEVRRSSDGRRLKIVGGGDSEFVVLSEVGA